MLKNLRKKYIIVFTLALLVIATGIAFAAGSQGQVSSMSGQVVYAIATGTRVSEGTVLVKVKTLAGSAPAARANCSGTVVSVVSNGANISAGQTVAQIQP
jgi:biotin carboxyl carrier protein